MEWTQAPSEAKAIIAHLIERVEEHEHMRAEDIMVLARREEGGRVPAGKEPPVRVSLVTSKELAMIAQAISDWNVVDGRHQEYKYIFIVNLWPWHLLTEPQKHYVIDHQLSRCGVTKTGKPIIRDEPIKVFPGVANRHGPVFSATYREFVADLRQLPLFTVDGEPEEDHTTVEILPPVATEGAGT